MISSLPPSLTRSEILKRFIQFNKSPLDDDDEEEDDYIVLRNFQVLTLLWLLAFIEEC